MTEDTEKKLTPANENPWYVMMTLAGEQTGAAPDAELHQRNRRLWNGWVVRELGYDAKAKMIELGWARKNEFDLGERLGIWTSHEHSLAEKNFEPRLRYKHEFPALDELIDLRYTMFECSLNCSGFIFAQPVFFQKSKIVGDIKFRSALFLDAALFNSVSFSGDVDFHNANFCDDAVFYRSAFSGRVDFGNATFRAQTLFRGVRFKYRPPEFYNAGLYEDTDLTDVRWPFVPEDRDKAIQHRRAYERLKLLMDDQKKFADEHFFLRKELECREVENPRSLATFASRAFRLLSNYGESISRPLAALGIVWAIGWGAMFLAEWADYWLGVWPDCAALPAAEQAACQKPEFLGPGQAAALSFSNLFAFLGLGWHIMRDELRSLTAFSEAVATAQMVAGPVLLFLLALGLRNRFRIK